MLTHLHVYKNKRRVADHRYRGKCVTLITGGRIPENHHLSRVRR